VASPVTTTAGTEMAVAALTDKGYTTLGDVIDAAKGGEEIRFGTMSPVLSDLAYVIGKENGIQFNIVQVRGGRAVMDGLNAGNFDIGFGAGVQARAVAVGDMVELASAKTGPLSGAPDAPQLKDYNMAFTNDTMFLILGPVRMDDAVRDALASAISDVLTTEGSEAAGFITKGFGGVKMVQGDALVELVANGDTQAAALLEASE